MLERSPRGANSWSQRSARAPQRARLVTTSICQPGMWPLVVALLLGHLHYGSAQLLFNNIDSVKVNPCNKVVVIPCHVSNIEAEDIGELYVKWKFGGNVIFSFDGALNSSTTTANFRSAQILPSELLKGNVSLMLNKNEAKEGNYTCEVTELSRQGKHTVELTYVGAPWFVLSENIPIIVLPFLTILLFWVQFGILIQKYKTNPINKKTIVLSTSGVLFTVIVIAGATIFIPGNYSEKKNYGLIFLVSPFVIPVFLQYHKFRPAIGRTLYAMIILTAVQALGYVLTIAGLYLTVNVCVPKYGSLLISGFVIITLVELSGLIYMKWLGILNATVLVQTRMPHVYTIPSTIGSPVAFPITAAIMLFS